MPSSPPSYMTIKKYLWQSKNNKQEADEEQIESK
jgi:hypothetical protein